MGNDGRLTLQPIATIENDFPTKFGVPRQSGIVDELRSRIVFLRNTVRRKPFAA